MSSAALGSLANLSAVSFSLASVTLLFTIPSAAPTKAPPPGIVEAAALPAPKATSLATSLKSAPVPTFPNPAPKPPATAPIAVHIQEF